MTKKSAVKSEARARQDKLGGSYAHHHRQVEAESNHEREPDLELTWAELEVLRRTAAPEPFFVTQQNVAAARLLQRRGMISREGGLPFEKGSFFDPGTITVTKRGAEALAALELEAKARASEAMVTIPFEGVIYERGRSEAGETKTFPDWGKRIQNTPLPPGTTRLYQARCQVPLSPKCVSMYTGSPNDVVVTSLRTGWSAWHAENEGSLDVSDIGALGLAVVGAGVDVAIVCMNRGTAEAWLKPVLVGASGAQVPFVPFDVLDVDKVFSIEPGYLHVALSMTMPGAFSLKSIVAEGPMDGSIDVLDVLVDYRSQLISGDGLPLEAFSEDNPQQNYDTIPPGSRLRIHLRNHGTKPQNVSFKLRGIKQGIGS